MTYIIYVTGGPWDSGRVQHTPQTDRIDIGQPRNQRLEFDSFRTTEEIEGPILFKTPQQDFHPSIFCAEDHSEEVGNARGVIVSRGQTAFPRVFWVAHARLGMSHAHFTVGRFATAVKIEVEGQWCRFVLSQ